MRVLFVTTDALIGGAERFLATLGANWPAGDRRVLVVLMSRGSLSEVLEESFDEVIYLGFSPTSRNLPGMVRALGRVIRRERPDVISSHLFHADLVTLLAPTPVPKTTTIHTQGFGPADHPLTKLIARTVGRLSFRFRAVIPASDSPQMAEFARKLKMRNLVSPIRNGTALPPAPTFDTASRSFTSIARNHPVKGHQILYSAFAALAADFPDWTLRTVGPGVTPEELPIADPAARELAEAGRITREGPTDTPEEVLGQSGAVVISSLYGEAFPIVGAEAAAAGVPVIATEVGSCPEFADDKRFVARPGDTADLTRALREFASLTDAERAELSHQARARAERDYSPAAVVAAYRKVFETISHARG